MDIEHASMDTFIGAAFANLLKPGVRFVWEKSFSQETVRAFSKLTGDNNVIHFQDNCKSFGLERAVVHGALLIAEFSRFIGRCEFIPEQVYAARRIQEANFSGYAEVGEKLEFSVALTKTKGGFHFLDLQIRNRLKQEIFTSKIQIREIKQSAT